MYAGEESESALVRLNAITGQHTSLSTGIGSANSAPAVVLEDGGRGVRYGVEENESTGSNPRPLNNLVFCSTQLSLCSEMAKELRFAVKCRASRQCPALRRQCSKCTPPGAT
ncbi:hypothetical protein CDAR_396411 [Caerostris darwini]|uniref:Uncharacterized protein n=1 Tax=Caerostris darwini TaxID=1538125 RepID=A0AAV4UT43_9ARAC|nr:hypothetical protein CDAR_396411 [Caerostris darwini]